jgi:(p)ppGpp synthase/HD superfamily hydrolase
MNLDTLRWAKYYATIKHGDQKYGNLPYTHHLAAVEAVLRRFGVDALFAEEMLEAAWLHDVVEDSGTKIKEIEELFGHPVARLVAAVTNEPGKNRTEKAAYTYPKIREAGANAVRLKLADRIANVENGGKLVEMYRKEYDSFRRGLYTAGQNEDMWKHLDSLLAPVAQVVA